MYSFLKKGKLQSSKRRKKTPLAEVRRKANSGDLLAIAYKDVFRKKPNKTTFASTPAAERLSKRRDQANKGNEASRHVKDAMVLLREFDQLKALAIAKKEFDILEQAKKALALPVEFDMSLNIYRQINKNLQLQDQLRNLNKINNAVTQAAQSERHGKSMSALEQAKRTLSLRNKVQSCDFLKSSTHVFVSWHRQVNQFESFKKDLEYALERKANLEDLSKIPNELEKLKAFQKTFDSMQQFDRYIEKASAFQNEIDRATELKKSRQHQEKLVDDLKLYVFSKIKDQNYRASLKLEGLNSSSDVALSTLESIRAKYAG